MQWLCKRHLALRANLLVTADRGKHSQQEPSIANALVLIMWLQKGFLNIQSVKQCSDSWKCTVIYMLALEVGLGVLVANPVSAS